MASKNQLLALHADDYCTGNTHLSDSEASQILMQISGTMTSTTNNAASSKKAVNGTTKFYTSFGAVKHKNIEENADYNKAEAFTADPTLKHLYLKQLCEYVERQYFKPNPPSVSISQSAKLYTVELRHRQFVPSIANTPITATQQHTETRDPDPHGYYKQAMDNYFRTEGSFDDSNSGSDPSSSHFGARKVDNNGMAGTQLSNGGQFPGYRYEYQPMSPTDPTQLGSSYDVGSNNIGGDSGNFSGRDGLRFSGLGNDNGQAYDNNTGYGNPGANRGFALYRSFEPIGPRFQIHTPADFEGGMAPTRRSYTGKPAADMESDEEQLFMKEGKRSGDDAFQNDGGRAGKKRTTNMDPMTAPTRRFTPDTVTRGRTRASQKLQVSQGEVSASDTEEGRRTPANRMSMMSSPVTPQDALLIKRDLPEAEGSSSVKRAVGPYDPENLAIVNMYDYDGKEWRQIAKELNDKRVKHGRVPSLTPNCVILRYNRTAPIYYESIGQEFIPLKKRKKGALPGQEFEIKDQALAAWDNEQDRALALMVKNYDEMKWKIVAEAMNGAFPHQEYSDRSVATRFRSL
ncbi:hypothetical protein BJ878DRAFT_550313 [Calycina marina]|uniref:Uncharacterized protein n=1 Tax=Calycina marina TaxID=1763456 RepID=A0A9P7Z380_9HELO|nr:hypothetical protein BJ878DRAFT_550313 [Calycina marina]